MRDMVWKGDVDRDQVQGLLAALDRQARDALALGEKAQRDVGGDRFASYLDFRRKVEEVRSLAALTEDRLTEGDDPKVADLHAEFERMDLVLTRLLVKATRNYFASVREDQALPMGAREMFEPEQRAIAGLRVKLAEPRYAEKLPASVHEDLAETEAAIGRIMARTFALPDFSDAPSPPRRMRPQQSFGRPVGM